MATLSFVNLIPIFLVFILYFMGMPIVYALFGGHPVLRYVGLCHELWRHQRQNDGLL